MATKKGSPAERAQLPVTESPDFRSVYSNNAQVAVSLFDFRLTFAESDGERIEKKLAVSMSPQHAKALLSVLAHNVEEYESQVGPIVLPARITDSAAKA